MTFTFPFRPIWFNQLKSPTKKHKTKQKQALWPYKAGSKKEDVFSQIKSVDKIQSRVFVLLIFDARIALQTKLPLSLMVSHLFQNYDTMYVRFFPTYTCNHSCYTIYVRFLSRILAFYSQVYDHFLTNAHIYAHKKAHIYALQTSMWYMGSQKDVV